MSTERVSFIRDWDRFWGYFKHQLLKNRTRNRVNKIALSFCIWLCCCRPFRGWGWGGGGGKDYFLLGPLILEREREREFLSIGPVILLLIGSPLITPFRLYGLH